ncbi:hypothetical protein N7486_000046 [Penicillium sp. IBT 16267x]|nr:hypothetical protein N7486_000046 [Penicillium sp. IBT 16267x]
MAKTPQSRPIPSNSGVLSEQPNRANTQPTSHPTLAESDEAQVLNDTRDEKPGKPSSISMIMANDQKRQPLISNFGVLRPNPNKVNIQQTLPNPPKPSNPTLNEPTRKRKRLRRGRRCNASEQELSTELGGMEEQTLGLSGVEVAQKAENDNLPLLGVEDTQECEDHLLRVDEDHLSHEDEDYLPLHEDEEYTSDLEEASRDAEHSTWPENLEFDAELLKSARVKIVEASPRHDSRLAGLVKCCLRIVEEEASLPNSQQNDIVLNPDTWIAQNFLNGNFHRAADTGAQGVYFDVVMSNRQLNSVYVGSSGGMMRRIKTRNQIVELLKLGKAETYHSSLYYTKLQEPVKSHHFVFAQFPPPPLPTGCVQLLEAIATIMLGGLQKWGPLTSSKFNAPQVSALIERARSETYLVYHSWEPLNAAFQLLQGFKDTIPMEARICSNKDCKAHGDVVLHWHKPRSEWGPTLPGPLIYEACYDWALSHGGQARTAAQVEIARLHAIPVKDRECSNPSCDARGEEVTWRLVKEEWKEFLPGPFLCMKRMK